MTRFLGDWSNHDADRAGGVQLDFAAIARDGIVGGWHKTSDGWNFYRDPYWPDAIGRMRKAFSAGVYGSYHVLHGQVSINGQVDWWLSILDATAPGWRADPRFVLMTDNEPFGYNTTPSIGQVNGAGDHIRAVCGKTMLAYAPPWVYGSALSGLRYPLVSSNYGNNPVTGYRQAYAAAGGDTSPRWTAAAVPVAVLQYGSATVQGPYQSCDSNAVLDRTWTTLFGADMPLTPADVAVIRDADVWPAPIADPTNPTWTMGSIVQYVLNPLIGMQRMVADIDTRVQRIAAKVDALPGPTPVSIDTAQLAAALADPVFLAAIRDAAEAGGEAAVRRVLGSLDQA